MNTEHVYALDIAKDFTRFPAGRLKSDGPHSGEAFRELLEQHLKKDEVVRVGLDGVLGFGSSFLEEAFGGLVRRGFNAALLARLLILETRDDSLKREIESYISSAAR